MLGEKAVLGDALLALNPAGDGHCVLLQNLRGDKLRTIPFGEPFPRLLVDLHCQQVFAIFLLGGEERLGRRHGLAFEVGGGIGEVQHGQFALAGITVGKVVRQRFFLAARADARPALSVCHAVHLPCSAGHNIYVSCREIKGLYAHLKARKRTRRGGPAMCGLSF